MTHKAAEVLGPSQWTPRERELLAVTMRLLKKHGYCGLTLDAVAATARASKTTVYRRWPSKAELVLAALIEGVRQIAALPETGSLRGDLLKTRRDHLPTGKHARKYHASGAGRGVAQSRPQRR